MINKKFLVLIIILLVSVFLIAKYRGGGGGSGSMVGPELNQVTESPQPTPTPTPREFKFDSSTDLKQELDFINPQVLDSDFEGLE